MSTNLDRSLDSLQPEFRARVVALLNQAKAVAIELRVNETLRSFARSDELYAIGRTKKGRVVTNARAGQSYHNYGVAVDLYPVDPKTNRIDVNFDRSPVLMAQMLQVAKFAKSLGIEWGGGWKFRDLPHFQCAKCPRIAQLKELYPSGWVPGKSVPYKVAQLIAK